MSLDFSKCTVLQPEGEKLREMYRILWQMFPYDRPVYDEMLQTGRPFYTLSSYALYQGEEFVGHAGIIPIRIWLSDRKVEVVGVGAVATVPKFRRMGVANFLMKYCTRAIDQRQSVSALYTELPATYTSHGFEVVAQHYSACSIKASVWEQAGYECELLNVLNPVQTAEMAKIYTHNYPNYDGKIDRDERYWDLYRMLFNPYPKPKIVFACRSRELYGYARFDQEDDRITVTELCSSPEDIKLAESLLKAVWDYAIDKGLSLCSFALQPKHFVWDILRKKDIEVANEPEGVRREIFMLRPQSGHQLGDMGRLQWSLADKF